MRLLAVTKQEEVIHRILSYLKLLSSGGQATSPTSEGTKLRVRLLNIDAQEIT